MNTPTHKRAPLALLFWLIAALGVGYFLRQHIEQWFGPDSWWMVSGWFGTIVGLVHFLILLVFARQPRGGGIAY